jgi:hypothetical protein
MQIGFGNLNARFDDLTSRLEALGDVKLPSSTSR